MKHYRRFGYLGLAMSVALLLIAVVIAPLSSGAAPAPSAEQMVQRAWQRAQEAGAYRFATEIVQTTYPAPALANVGRTSFRETLHIEGETNLPERTLLMTLWKDGGNVLNPRDGVEMRVEGDRAYGRAIGGAWQEADDFSDAFAPGHDLMAYLAGAKNVQEVGTETRAGITFRRYGFDFDGPAFAAYFRDQLEAYLLEKGELPLDMTLDTPRQYLQMTGQGEVWIDSQGLPLRLIVHLVYPPQRNGERVEAEVKTDFSGYSEQLAIAYSLAENPVAWASSALHLPHTRRGWGNAGGRLGFLAGCLGFLFVLVAYRRVKRIYATVVIIIVFSMVFTPLLQSQQVAAFFDRQAARQAKQEKTQKEREAARDLEAQLTGNWDPHRDPLAYGRIKGSNELTDQAVGSAQYATRDTQHELDRSPLSTLQSSSAENPDTDQDGLSDAAEQLIGTDPTIADSDGDTLSDGVELLRLATDPMLDDSDGDGIYDNVELQGFYYADQHWYLDPMNPDTNGDGQLDTVESMSVS